MNSRNVAARTILHILLAGGLIASGVPSGPVSAQAVREVALRAGHSLVIETPGLTRAGVGDQAIAGVVAFGNSEVVINGKSIGSTTVFVEMGKRRVTYDVRVTEPSLDGLVRLIRTAIANPAVQVTSSERSIAVVGSVSSNDDFLRIQDVVGRFSKAADAGKYTIVDAVTVAQTDLAAGVESVPGVKDVTVERDVAGNIIVGGTVSDRAAAEVVLDRVRSSAGTALGADAKIVDRLSLQTTTQVDVKVYVLEVDRTAQSQLGLRLQAGTPDVNHPGYYVLGSPSFPALETTPKSALNVGSFLRTTILAPTLDLVLNSGHARVLSSPDLVTMPGREANFLVGGQIPIPYASGPSQISVEYKDFGVQLKVTPTILGNGSIETLVAPEVSDLDYQDGVAISGFTIPALKTSRLATDVVTRSGESIVLGGLMSRSESRNVTKIPLLGDIPVLGQLFRSTSYQKSETDLVFVMTPEILVR